MKNKLKVFNLCFLLIGAALIHLFNPNAFLPILPGFIPFKIELIILTGYLELLLALGLMLNKYRRISAIITASYFVILLPIHIYIAYYGIEIFGTHNKVFLWIRFFLQFPLIFWSYSLKEIH